MINSELPRPANVTIELPRGACSPLPSLLFAPVQRLEPFTLIDAVNSDRMPTTCTANIPTFPSLDLPRNQSYIGIDMSGGATGATVVHQRSNFQSVIA